MPGLSLFSVLNAGNPLNRAHWLAPYIKLWWLTRPMGHPAFFGGKQARDLGGLYHGTLTNMDPGTDWRGSQGRPGGRGFLDLGSSGATEHVDFGDQAAFDFGTGNLTLLFWFRSTGLVRNPCAVMAKDDYDSGASGILISAETSTANVPGWWGGSAYAVFTGSLDSNWHYLAVRRNGTTVTVYTDAVQVNTVTDSRTLSNVHPLRLGNDKDAIIGGAFQADDLMLLDRDIGAAGIKYLYDQSRMGHPDLLSLARRNWTVSAGGGATQYSLTADPGSYTITGTAASLKVSRKVSADSGTYAVTGTAASLKVGRKLTADAGSYAVTGTTASLERGYLLAAASGSYVITGTDATLTVSANPVLTADSGSYVITGTAASLERGYLLSAVSGSYVITGTDATLTVAGAGTFSLAADPGVYAITGTAATLRRTTIFTADPGSYVVTGTAATLKVGRKVTADPGTYTITGTAAAFLLGYRLTADAGVYAITGTAATLFWSGEIGPAVGTVFFQAGQVYVPGFTAGEISP